MSCAFKIQHRLLIKSLASPSMDQNIFLQKSHAQYSISPMPSNYSSSSSIFLISSLHSSHTSSSTSTFPITAVAIIGILATCFLLVSYYIFVIKCCLNWHRIDLLRRFSFSGRRSNENPLMNPFPSAESNRGLDETIIRSIPIVQYKKDGRRRKKERSLCECAVCLNEFQEEEKLRVIPNCCHVFHIDCIDIWLQNNANCPLCRTSISAEIINFSRDEDYVVIEIGDEENNPNIPNHTSLLKVEERLMDCGDELSAKEISQSLKWKKKLSYNVGDECIDNRHKDEQFGIIQPIRRSFSMDSASDPQFHLAVQVILQQQQQQVIISSSRDQSSSSSSKVVRRSFFSFGHDRTSRSAVLPLHLEP